MGSEQRRSQRKAIGRHVWIVHENGSFLGECLLGNMSDTGAKLTFEAPLELPDRFILRLSLDGRVARKCRLAWKEGTEIGVTFTAKFVSVVPQVPLELHQIG